MTIDEPREKRLKLSSDDENKNIVSPVLLILQTVNSLQMTMAEDWQQAFAKEFEKGYFKKVLYKHNKQILTFLESEIKQGKTVFPPLADM